MTAFWIALIYVLVAEMGDKTQLVALAFATRYRASSVMLGVFLATLVIHLFSVVIGEAVSYALPVFWIQIVSGVAFVIFGLWTLRGDELNEEERAKAQKAAGSALFAVGLAFFLAELGDKTMLATVTLATDHGLFGTWIGSTLGMVLADALAIMLGLWLCKQLPEKVVKYGAAAAFAVFGVLLIAQGLAG